jgi:hypothetical protein
LQKSIRNRETGRLEQRHGHCLGGKSSPTHRSWCSMLQRCTNPRNKRYAHYGMSGVKVCKRWLKFENFLADMGKRPVGKTLGRFEDSGNYTPSNCAWQSRAQQEVERRKKQTHCKRGHLRTPENTRASFGGCRLCHNENARRYKKEKGKVTKK